MLTEPTGAKVCVRSARSAANLHAHAVTPRTRTHAHTRPRAHAHVHTNTCAPPRHTHTHTHILSPATPCARAGVLWRINTQTNLALFTDLTGSNKVLSNYNLAPSAFESTLPSPNLCIRIERRSGCCACLNILSDRADTWSSVFMTNGVPGMNAALTEKTYTGAQPTRRRVGSAFGTATLRMRKPGRPQGVCVHGIHDSVNGQHDRPAAEPALHHQHHRRGRDGWEVR
jgi:hypothetical protein